jgi:hypothetical protein
MLWRVDPCSVSSNKYTYSSIEIYAVTSSMHNEVKVFLLSADEAQCHEDVWGFACMDQRMVRRGCSAVCAGRLPSGKEQTRTWVDPRTSLDEMVVPFIFVGRQTMSRIVIIILTYRRHKPTDRIVPSVVQPVASCYTDCASSSPK